MSDKQSKLNELTKWPVKAADVSVDGLLRVIGADAQRVWLEKWKAIDAEGMDAFMSPLYTLRVEVVLASVGFMACLRRLRELDADAAQRFAIEYWQMCDAGDSVGEMLWEFTEAAGLDPGLIQLPCDEANQASAGSVGIPANTDS